MKSQGPNWNRKYLVPNIKQKVGTALCKARDYGIALCNWDRPVQTRMDRCIHAQPWQSTLTMHASQIIELSDRFEIVSLVGTMCEDGAHLHISLADEEGKVIGGHLLSASIFTTAEVVLGEVVGACFSRVYDPLTGFPELSVAPGRMGLVYRILRACFGGDDGVMHLRGGGGWGRKGRKKVTQKKGKTTGKRMYGCVQRTCTPYPSENLGPNPQYTPYANAARQAQSAPHVPRLRVCALASTGSILGTANHADEVRDQQESNSDGTEPVTGMFRGVPFTSHGLVRRA